MADCKVPMVGHKGVVLGLYGAGGFAREVMPFVSASLIATGLAATTQIYFVETQPQRTAINGVPLISEADFFALDCQERYFNIAISDAQARERLAAQCLQRGAQPLALQSPQAVINGDSIIGAGAIFCAFTMVTANAKIGQFFHANIYSYVAHDCVIGDFVTFAPRVSCNGNVHIHNHAYIGTGAVLKQGTADKPLVIGQGAIIGMGAVVTKDVPAYTTVVGNPARVLLKT